MNNLVFASYGEIYPAAHDLTTLRVIACAGEPLNPEALVLGADPPRR